MDGNQYVKYLQSQKIKLSFGMKKALPYFFGCFIGILLLIFLIDDLTPDTNVKPTFDSWYKTMENRDDYSWDALLRIGFVYVFPWAVAMILISWFIHGVGFYLVRR
jgi:hypothetical protein